jgi:hypothetical protein
MTGWTILHIVIGSLIAALTTSVVFSVITTAVYQMESTSGGSDEFTGVAIIISFVLLIIPALLIVAGLVLTDTKVWWAYALGGGVMALTAGVIFVGEFNTRLITFSTIGGIVGGAAAFLYLKYGAKLWEAGGA